MRKFEFLVFHILHPETKTSLMYSEGKKKMNVIRIERAVEESWEMLLEK
jgi:hypothetical protein